MSPADEAAGPKGVGHLAPEAGDDEQLNDQVLIGRVLKAHGIKGELVVLPVSISPADFKSYQEVILADRRYPVVSSRSHGKFVILALRGVETRNAAETLCGAELRLPKSEFPPLAAGKYYRHELAGCAVSTADGRELGIVTAFFSTKAHDIMVVTGRGQEYLLPVRKEIIVCKDDRHRRLVIVPPPGLLEIND